MQELCPYPLNTMKDSFVTKTMTEESRQLAHLVQPYELELQMFPRSSITEDYKNL